jgi:hypothetical protein
MRSSILLVVLVAASFAGVADAARGGGGKGRGGGRGRHSMGSRMPIMIHRNPASANYYNNKDVSFVPKQFYFYFYQTIFFRELR